MTASSPLFAVTDAAGSVYGLFGANAAADGLELKSEYSYSVFGERNLISGTDLTVIGYDSEQLDESGLIYLRARYYDPATAQFVSIDPALSMTLDAFGLTGGNPLQRIDPSGMNWITDSAKWLYENSSDISMYLGTAALITSTVPFVGPILGVASGTFGVISLVKHINEKDPAMAALDIIGIIPVIGSLAKGAKATQFTYKASTAQAGTRISARASEQSTRAQAHSAMWDTSSIIPLSIGWWDKFC